MAEEVAALSVRIEATTAQFERKMDQTVRRLNTAARRMERRASRLDRNLSKIGAGFGRALAPITAALTGGALIRGFDRAITKLDEIGKTADKVGVTTDALQELRSAAEQSGVSAGTLDLALQRFARRVGEARTGSGELKDTLSDLNIELNNADGTARPLEALLNDLADGMAGASDDGERLRIAFKAFDSEGAALVNALKNGSAGLETMRQRARELNGVIEEDSIRAAETLRNEIDLLSTSLSNTFVAAAGRAAQAINDLINVGTARALESKIEELRGVQNQLSNIAINGQKGRRAGPKLGDLQKQEASLSAEIQRLQGVLDAETSGISVAPRLARTGVSKDRESNRTSEIERLNTALAKQLDLLSQEAKLLGLEGPARARVEAGIVRERTERELLHALLKEGGELSAVEFQRARETADGIEAATIAIAEERSALEMLIDAKRRDADATDQMNQGIAELGNRFVQAAQRAEGFRDALKNIGVEILNLVTRGLGGQGPLGSTLSGFVGSLFSGAGGGNFGPQTSGLSGAFGSPSSVGSVGFANGGVFQGGKVIPFAKGGIINGPTVAPMALMGEAGPEAILPLSRGADGRLGVRSAGGGGTVVQVINQTGQTVREERQRGPDGSEMVRIIVGEQISGGEHDQALGGRYGAVPTTVAR